MLLLSTCRQVPFDPILPVIVVEQTSLDFGAVVVTARASQSLQLLNQGRASGRVTLHADEPFELDRTLDLAAGDEVSVPLSFIPRRVGVVTSTARIYVEGGDDAGIRVELRGEGVAPPVCQTPWACWEAHLENGACVTSKRADGTACTDACLSGAHCVDGVCEGAPLLCPDDGNACTVEACSADGCRSVPLVCAPSSNPCKVSRCDAQRGCVEDDAVDGVACGTARGCASADVCISGQCVTRAQPDGAPCGTASPCQDAGVCRQGACAQPAPTPLRPAFTSNGHSAYGPLSISDAGLMRVPGAGQTWEARFDARQLHLSADGLYVGQPDYRSIAVVRAADGVQLWQARLDTFFTGISCPGGGPITYFNLYELALDGTDELLLRGWEQCGANGSMFHNVVVAVGRNTGEVRWLAERSASSMNGLVGAATGGAWFIDGTPRQLIRASRQGALTTRAVPNDATTLLAVTHGVAWLLGADALHAVPLDGGVVLTSPWTEGITAANGFAEWNGHIRYVDFSLDAGATLRGGSVPVRLGDGGTQAGASLAMLDDGSALVGTRQLQAGGSSLLSLVRFNGDLVWQCPAPAAGAFFATEVQHGVAVLGDLGAYAVPGLEAAPASAGWTQRYATPSRTGREIP